MELLVQKYLRSGKSFEDLFLDHGVKANISNNKISLNYNQIEASTTDQLASQCRGLVLDLVNNYEILACPMFRFFNIEQKEIAANIDWNSAAYEEKLDGTNIIAYYYENKWFVATRGRAEADCVLDSDTSLTFTKLANIAAKKMYENFNKTSSGNVDFQIFMNQISKENYNKTFVFELTSPYNRVICEYEEVKLTLLAVRDNITLTEESPEAYVGKDDFGLKTPRRYHFSNINHMIQVVREFDPKYHEGIVVKDKNFNRVKVKNPSYLAYNHMLDSLGDSSIKGCLEIILLEKDDDVLPMMPQYIQDRIVKLKPIVRNIFQQTYQDFENIKHINDMKEFAIKAKQCVWPAALFALKRGITNDLKLFAIGNKLQTKIPSSNIKTFIAVMKKFDKNILEDIF